MSLPGLPPLDPGTLLIVAGISAVAGMVSFVAFQMAERDGPKISEKLPKLPVPGG